MKMKKLLSLLVCFVVMCTVISGCGSDKKNSSSNDPLPSKLNEIAMQVEDTSEIEDWKGSQKELIYWFCQGTGAPTIGKKTKDTTISDELKRISGISWDEDMSFDNNGDNGDTKISKIIAANTWPDVAYNLDKNLVVKLSESGKIWDLTELIPKYMTNFMKVVNYSENSKKAFENFKIDGKSWYIPKASVYATERVFDENYSPEKYAVVNTPEDSRGWIWVRDDILKKIYPEAKTLAEIEKLYLEKGEFSKEDYRDAVITSKEDFKDFLVKIRDLNMTENGRKVYPIYTHNGTDNWDILAVLNFMCGAVPSTQTNYFAYFDNGKKEIVRTADQAWFKDWMKFCVGLVQEGLASKEALVDNKAAFEQKKNNGEYAILYANVAPPTAEQLKANGKNYAYRKVLVDIPVDYSKFIKHNTTENYFTVESFTLFKTDNIKTQSDVEQVLRYIDSFFADSVEKTLYWGPKTNPLYTGEGSEMKYKDKFLEEDIVYNGANGKGSDYGITAFPSLENFSYHGMKVNPKVVYGQSEERNPKQYLTKWNYSFVEPVPNYPFIKTEWKLWNWTTQNDKLRRFWDARQASEDAFKVIFTAKNNSEFEDYYKEMLSVLDRNGLNAETIKEWNVQFKEDNKDYWNDFVSWKKN